MKWMNLFSWGVTALAAGLALGGCVERTMTIATDPPGALVSINDVAVGGRSTVIVPFTWYGDYDFRFELIRNEGTLEKPVWKKYYLHTHKKIDAPVHQWLGLDLLSDLAPWEIRDDQLLAFIIPPVEDPTDEELIKRAKELQNRLGEPEELRPTKRPNGKALPPLNPTTAPAAAAPVVVPTTAPKSGPATRP